MIKQYQACYINDDTKLIRFLDIYGAEKSIGLMNHRDVECTFHYGLLHHYKYLETIAGDAKEGSTSIKLSNGIIGCDATANNALISCWSIWNENYDPWFAFQNSSFAKDEKYVCAIVSTVGKIKKIFQQTIEINQLLLGDNFPYIVFHPVHSPVTYYPRESGVSNDHWREITDVTKHGLIARTTHNIFYKRDSNEKGQRYDAECEYRFAMILGNRHFFGSDNNIAICAEDVIVRDYPLILRGGSHFIEKVYLRKPHPKIKATCYFAGIELIEYSENAALGTY